jgi:hypothetical protein
MACIQLFCATPLWLSRPLLPTSIWICILCPLHSISVTPQNHANRTRPLSCHCHFGLRRFYFCTWQVVGWHTDSRAGWPGFFPPPPRVQWGRFAQLNKKMQVQCLIQSMAHGNYIINESDLFDFCFSDVGDGTQDFTHTRQVLSHWATPPANLPDFKMQW